MPGFSHEPRWSTTSSLKKFLSNEILDFLQNHPSPNPLEDLPLSFGRWESLSQAQYFEVVTLLSPYLISSQGDRMLMAHSIEGRFPFLDADVMEFCNSLPAEYKLNFLDEKHILKKVASGFIPDSIVHRKKQAYRAPDAASFLHQDAPEYVRDLFSDHTLKASGVFNPQPARALYQKCISKRDQVFKSGLFSNTDNMSFVGILSTQLVFNKFIDTFEPADASRVQFQTIIDSAQHPLPAV
jgi:asparagine synthase (glutamine-hydrolysing)